MIDRQPIDRIADQIHVLNAALHSIDSDSPPVVAFVGAFSRGKSALINALLESSLLPAHPLPTTAVPTFIAYSEIPSARFVYTDYEDQVTVADAQAIFAYRTPDTGLCEIQIGWPSALLQSGLVLLDTPGIDAQRVHPALGATARTSPPAPLHGEGGQSQSLPPRYEVERGTEGVRFALGYTHAQPSPLAPLSFGMESLGASAIAVLLFIFAADPPLGEVELDFLREVAPTVPRIVLVQTKCDTLPESDLQTATEFNRAAIDSVCPTLKTIPIVSVSALTGTGIPSLRAMIAGWDMDQLRRERAAWQTEAIQRRLYELTNQLDAQRTHLETIRAALDSARTACIADLETIHAGVLATLARWSEYALGNLSAAIYRADPAELTGGRGLTLANNELRRLRDQLTGEIERALLASRRCLIESLTAAEIAQNAVPDCPSLRLPDPQVRTVAVRIRERRVFLPKQLDAGPTTNAYRTAVAHMADAYAAELLPPIERYLADYRNALLTVLDSRAGS